MRHIDQIGEKLSRSIAQNTSRRHLLGIFGSALIGVSALPLLPVARAAGVEHKNNVSDDPKACGYWRYCAVDGYLCSCCGGSYNECPPGTEMSPVTWIGTCLNPSDGKNYIISYNDCCGKSSCGRCACSRNEGGKPMYKPFLSNEYNWCLGTKSQAYHCSTAIVLGPEQQVG